MAVLMDKLGEKQNKSDEDGYLHFTRAPALLDGDDDDLDNFDKESGASADIDEDDDDDDDDDIRMIGE